MNIPADLLSGYRLFRSGRFAEEAERFRALSAGQQPHTMIIGCADSRVDPATIFSAGPGELFVVRNVAALVPPCEIDGGYHGTSAALEFAVTGLKVSNIIVMGHGLCGGVSASLALSEGSAVGSFLGPWVSILDKVRDEMLGAAAHLQGEDRQRALEHLSVRQSLDNLKGFPFINDALFDGQLSLHGAWFSIAEGELQWLDLESGTFERVAE